MKNYIFCFKGTIEIKGEELEVVLDILADSMNALPFGMTIEEHDCELDNVELYHDM